MATDTRYIATCDRCGQEAETDEPETLPDGWLFMEPNHPNPGTKEYDLCPGCVASLVRWFESPVAADSAAETVDRHDHRFRIGSGHHTYEEMADRFMGEDFSLDDFIKILERVVIDPASRMRDSARQALARSDRFRMYSRNAGDTRFQRVSSVNSEMEGAHP